MATKQFKAESKRLLDLMIHSIYTHKEIFLRELISNASDAIDKLYYRALSENITGLSRDDFAITLTIDKESRTLTVSDNGCGMTRDELESNLGTIAKSGSLAFKKEKEAKTVLIPFHADRQLDYNKQVFYRGGYLFLQSIKAMNFAKIQEQGFIPLYKREAITDALHEVSGFRTKKINRKYLRLILCIF